MINYRYLGNSGLKVTELVYGNWLTHASQVENEQAAACVKAALDVGITSFDTADAYANTGAETVLGVILKGERRESLELFTKVYWPTGPKGANDAGLSRKHIMESINGSLTRLQTDYVDLYQAHGLTMRRRSRRRWSPSRTSCVRARPCTSGSASGRRSRSTPARLSPANCASRSSRTSRSIRCCGASSKTR